MRGFQPGVVAFALATSFRNEMHWAPSGTASSTAGFFDAMLVTCDVGGFESSPSMVCVSTMSILASKKNGGA